MAPDILAPVDRVLPTFFFQQIATPPVELVGIGNVHQSTVAGEPIAIRDKTTTSSEVEKFVTASGRVAIDQIMTGRSWTNDWEFVHPKSSSTRPNDNSGLFDDFYTQFEDLEQFKDTDKRATSTTEKRED